MTDPDAKLREALDATARLYHNRRAIDPGSGHGLDYETCEAQTCSDNRAALAAPAPETKYGGRHQDPATHGGYKRHVFTRRGKFSDATQPYTSDTCLVCGQFHSRFGVFRSPEPPQPLGLETLTTDQAWKAARYLSDLVGKRLAQSNLGDLIAPADVRAALRSPAPKEA